MVIEIVVLDSILRNALGGIVKPKFFMKRFILLFLCSLMLMSSYSNVQPKGRDAPVTFMVAPTQSNYDALVPSTVQVTIERLYVFRYSQVQLPMVMVRIIKHSYLPPPTYNSIKITPADYSFANSKINSWDLKDIPE